MNQTTEDVEVLQNKGEKDLSRINLEADGLNVECLHLTFLYLPPLTSLTTCTDAAQTSLYKHPSAHLVTLNCS